MRVFKNATTGLLLAAVTALGSGSVQADIADDLNLPDLGQPADTAMSPAEEDRLGAQVIGQLRAHGQLMNDPELTEYINHVGHRLASQTDRPASKLHFHVVDDDEINGFALPGGYIGINAGLIRATRSESELASVMAHETAHVVQRHIARQMADSKGDNIASLATMIVGALAGAKAGGGDAATAAIMGGMSQMGMKQISYTRAHEHEADRVGIQILAKAGFDPQAMASFFGTLQRQSDLYGEQLPQILLSHPVSTTRIAEARARADKYPDVKVHTSGEYPYMKARARVISRIGTHNVRRHFRDKYQGDDAEPADKYGYALALAEDNQRHEAVRLMREGAEEHPDVLAWKTGLARALGQSGGGDKARNVLKQAMKQFPQNKALKLEYARNLMNQGKPDEMRDYLLSQEAVLDAYPEAQKLLASGAGRQKRLGEAYYREARYLAMLNDYPSAINQLRTALQTVDLSDYDSSRLKALQSQMMQACNRNWSNKACREGVKQNARTGRH